MSIHDDAPFKQVAIKEPRNPQISLKDAATQLEQKIASLLTLLQMGPLFTL